MSEGMLSPLAAAVRARETSARALVERSLERIAATAERLNAVVASDPQRALADADALDRGPRTGALCGLPLLVKDVEDAIGLPTAAGSLLVADPPPARRDAPVVAALRRQGAIVVGKASTSELAWEGHAWSPRHGATRSPWDERMSPGGSSGGSAAALSAGLAPLATAGDVGGSTRTPAAQCGLLGLKPTNGLLPADDQPGALDQLTPGLLAAHPADLRLLLELLTADTWGDAAPLAPAGAAHVRTVRVCARIVGREPLDDAVLAAFEAAQPAIERLAAAVGAELVRDAAPVIEDPGADDDTLVQFALDVRRRIGRERLEAHGAALDPSIVAGLAAVAEATLDDHLALRARRVELRRQMDAALTRTWIVTPTLTIPGLTAAGEPVGGDGRRGGAIPQSTTNTNLHNWTGHPAISLPAGLVPGLGTPFGVQVSAARGADRSLLDAAERWHRIAPWPPTAPGFAPFDAG